MFFKKSEIEKMLKKRKSKVPLYAIHIALNENQLSLSFSSGRSISINRKYIERFVITYLDNKRIFHITTLHTDLFLHLHYTYKCHLEELILAMTTLEAWLQTTKASNNDGSSFFLSGCASMAYTLSPDAAKIDTYYNLLANK